MRKETGIIMASGAHSGEIFEWDSLEDCSEPARRLSGHTDGPKDKTKGHQTNVTTLCYGVEGSLYSGSWDFKVGI